MDIPDGYNTYPEVGMLGADDNNNDFASTNVVANRDGSVLERLEDIRTEQTRNVKKALAAAALTGTATQFTISGGPVVIKHLGGLVKTAIAAGTNTLKFSVTPTGGAATDLCAATDTASAAINQLFLVDGVKATALVKTTDAGIGVAANEHMPIILAPGVIQTIFSAGAPATGAMDLFVEYEPLVPGASIA
jgi:hypothetical protein